MAIGVTRASVLQDAIAPRKGPIAGSTQLAISGNPWYLMSNLRYTSGETFQLGSGSRKVLVTYLTDIPNGIGNGLGTLLGFTKHETLDDPHVSQGAGKFANKTDGVGHKRVTDHNTIKTWQVTVGQPAALNKHARLLLHCSVVTSSRESDGKRNSDVIASIPNTGVALGARQQLHAERAHPVQDGPCGLPRGRVAAASVSLGRHATSAR